LGINIFIIDHRGQGLSQRLVNDPHKGFVNNFDDYTDDLYTFISSIVPKHCNSEEKPLLLSHSMGGAIAIRLLQRHPDTVKAALLSSPMISINKGSLPHWFARTVINSGDSINQLFNEQPWYFLGQGQYKSRPFENNDLMQSSIRYELFNELYQQNESLQLGGVTFHWLQQAIMARQVIFEQLNKIKTPVTIMQAGEDSVVENQVQNDFCQQLHLLDEELCAQKTPYIIKGAKHELFFEQDKYRNQALEYIVNWLKIQSL
jgi:lysophospholipase